ncbi:transmembrane protein 199-like [Rhopilema esculentum]|uniref:transmembrane protein 199-like n=1 Tax=Rhopilema esculentum TaxID=499914 RepID=UPI0031CDF36C
MEDQVLVRVTKSMKVAVEGLESKIFLDRIKQIDSVDVTEYKHVSQLFSQLQKQKPSKYKYFHEFLEGSGIYEEPVKEPGKSPELLARLERLKAEQEEKKYRSMVKNVTQKKRNLGEEFGAEVRTTSQQLTSVMNYIITILGCAFFAYYASEYAWNEIGMRILFSVIVGTVVALAELYFLAKTEI